MELKMDIVDGPTLFTLSKNQQILLKICLAKFHYKYE